jgi:hypothetical protein
MARVFVTKTSFTAGELDPRLLGRLDLKAQEDGAARLTNVLVQATGGVTRRPGLARVAPVPDARRLISFEAPHGLALVALAPGRISIARDGVVALGPQAPWDADQLGEIAWARCADRLLIVHPDAAPRALVERGRGDFALVEWDWETGGSDEAPATHQPYARFAPARVSLELRHPQSGRSDVAIPEGPVALAASEPVFDPLHVGATFRHRGREVLITSVDGVNGSRASGILRADVANGRATRDWDEQAFSAARGWPATVTVHQDRLVIGGSRDLPDRVWMSRTGRHFSFDLGDGLADEAIAFRLGGEELHAIRGLHAGRQLQVFTTEGEWVVRGAPLTPEDVQVELQTRVGSWSGRRLRPLDVDGATLFVGASGRELREFLYADSEQAYQAADIALLARHMLAEPADVAFDGRRRLLLVVRGDGRVAAVTIDRNSNVLGWSLLQTEGRALAVAAHGDEPWLLVELGGSVLLERLDDALGVDHGRTLTAPSPRTAWTGLGELAGREVVAVAGDGSVARAVVGADGTLALPTAQRRVVVGTPFAHVVEPMPVAVPSGRGQSQDHPYRPVRVSFRVLETAVLRADLGDGPRPVLTPPPSDPGRRVTGDVGLRALGWRRGLAEPPWRVEQDDPLPSTILSVTTEIKVND